MIKTNASRSPLAMTSLPRRSALRVRSHLEGSRHMHHHQLPNIDSDNSVLSVIRVSTSGVHSHYSGEDDELEDIFAAIAASPSPGSWVPSHGCLTFTCASRSQLSNSWSCVMYSTSISEATVSPPKSSPRSSWREHDLSTRESTLLSSPDNVRYTNWLAPGRKRK